MKLPVIISAAAAAELRDHIVRIARAGPTTARHLNEEVGTTFDLISEFPQLFVAAILDLRRNPAAIRRRLGLHESAANFPAGAAMALPSARPPLF